MPLASDTLAWLRLTLVPGITPTLQQQLLVHCGSAEEALRSGGPLVAAVEGAEVAGAFARGPETALLERTLQWLEAPDHHLLPLGSAPYPAPLLELSVPPTVLYARGRLELLARESVAIVGSRNATPQGLRDAHEWAARFSAEGWCVVSGLALGIDCAAHRGALRGPGGSIAVMGTGPDLLYPRRNRELALTLAQEGCILSEFPMGTHPAPGNFPRRNRLISGLSRGVVVVEAARQSGSLITAAYALEQGREVFAVPGSIHSPLSKGCHELIRQGATLVESAEEVLCDLRGMASRAAPSPAADEREEPVLEAMGFAPVSVDQLAGALRQPASAICARLARLEIEGRVQSLPGGWFQQVAPPHRSAEQPSAARVIE